MHKNSKIQNVIHAQCQLSLTPFQAFVSESFSSALSVAFFDVTRLCGKIYGKIDEKPVTDTAHIHNSQPAAAPKTKTTKTKNTLTSRYNTD